MIVAVPGPRWVRALATIVVWGISGFLVVLVLFIAAALAFNIDCARDGGGDARGTVTQFQRAVAARDWDVACELMTSGARARLADVASRTHELSPTCPAGLELTVRRGELRPGRIVKVSAPWLWDDATVTTTRGRYRLTSPDLDCRYLVKALD